MEFRTKVKALAVIILSILYVLVWINYFTQYTDTYKIRPYYCQANCQTGIPCEYPDEVDFRIIVMTYNRAHSLKHVLNSLLKLDTLNDKVSVEIWVDRNNKTGEIDSKTVNVGLWFIDQFTSLTSQGRGCIHLQTSNANIGGQWLFTWRPKHRSRELGLILEDDVVVSPLSYKWIKMLHTKYGHETNIAGYTLQMENIKFFSKVYNKGDMKGPAHQQVFLYPVIGTWGYAPHPDSWRKFQDWYLEMRPERNVKTDKIQPFVPGIIPTEWYHGFLSNGKQETMWEMWHMKFTYEYKLFTVYSNLHLYRNRQDVLLSNNRKERGLHFGGFFHFPNNKAHLLLKTWNRTFENLPSHKDLVHYNYNGSPCTRTCCFNTSCLTSKD